ncbi:MAG: putative rane protein [Deltaproteobacteria bacterium]|nr:putative rane protein [Deltaproteobacteria bacterium]
MAVKRRNGWIIGGVAAGILVVVVAAVSAGVLDGLLKKSPAEIGKAAGVMETADAVKIPLKALDSGKALFLPLESEGRQVYYFALKSRDGAYRAALDACDVCSTPATSASSRTAGTGRKRTKWCATTADRSLPATKSAQ